MSLTEKNSFWTKIVSDIEEESRAKLRKERIKNLDFSMTLPEDLRDRVANIMEYEFDDFDDTVFITESDVDIPMPFDEEMDELDEEENKVESKKPGVYNESTCSEIERMEHEFGAFDLVLEPPLKHKLEVPKKTNKFATYVCKPRKDRIVWNSKVYDLEKNIHEASLDEQAERLMDASAERFTEWLNTLGQNDLTKDKLKALFSIEGDWKLSASITTEPKEVKAIAKTVADKWNLPEMALELKYERYIAECLKNIPKTTVKVAFGRTVPMKERPWLPTGSSHVIAPVFPDELLTFEKLFKGITHLRSTRALIEFYKKKNMLQKPDYLVVNGCFNDVEQEAGNNEIPLYELLKLKY